MNIKFAKRRSRYISKKSNENGILNPSNKNKKNQITLSKLEKNFFQPISEKKIHCLLCDSDLNIANSQNLKIHSNTIKHVEKLKKYMKTMKVKPGKERQEEIFEENSDKVRSEESDDHDLSDLMPIFEKIKEIREEQINTANNTRSTIMKIEEHLKNQLEHTSYLSKKASDLNLKLEFIKEKNEFMDSNITEIQNRLKLINAQSLHVIMNTNPIFIPPNLLGQSRNPDISNDTNKN